MRKTFLTLLILFIYTPQAYAADVLWKAGAAAIKITPQKPVVMSGYASRTKPFDRVETDLFAKALALDDGAGHRALIVTMDLIGLSAAIAEPVAARIGEKNGLKREQMSLPARMIAIADVFEALTAEDRPYKRAKTVAESLAILGQMKLSGHVDPDLFDVFVRERVWIDYARKFLDPAQIDAVDLQQIPGSPAT